MCQYDGQGRLFCPSAVQDELLTQQRLAVVSDITLFTGIGLAATGAILLLVDHNKSRAAAQVSVSVAPDFSGGGSVLLQGSF